MEMPLSINHGIVVVGKLSWVGLTYLSKGAKKNLEGTGTDYGGHWPPTFFFFEIRVCRATDHLPWI